MDNITPQISVAPDQGRAEAFALIFSHLRGEQQREQVDTLLEAVAKGELSPEGLIGAYRDRSLVGAVLWQVQLGRTAAVWPPRVVANEPLSTAEHLLGVVCQSLAERGVQIAQILLEHTPQADEAVLRVHGFRHLADMLYLVCMEVEFPAYPPAGTLEFEPYCPENPENRDRLVCMIDATYEHSLDCPELDGVRAIEDVLAGYRGTGVFDPGRWLIVRHGGRDVGCLLLADHPALGNIELVYMGVAAAQRGHGWGAEIAQHAKWHTRQAGRRRLVLAVDAANSPAIRMYSSVGFQAWDRRRAYLKVFAVATGKDT